MKRNEFKALVKECVRECIREIMQEQIDPSGLQEALGARPRARAPDVINPFDPGQMRMRQEVMEQRNAISNQLQRQSMGQSNVLNQPLAPLNELAGLGSLGDGGGPEMYNREAGSGYTNPSDRMLQAGPPVNMMRSYGGSHLDVPMGAHRQPMGHVQRPVVLDPSLDTPIYGGDMRPPDPNVLRSIFEDTARTTYVQQAAAGHTRPSHHEDGGGGGGQMAYAPVDRFAATVANHRPEELFTGSDQWATLAFR